MTSAEPLVGIYGRVSTKDRQEVFNQLSQLREFCTKNGWPVYREYIDKDDGGDPGREEFNKLFTDAYQKRINIVLFWALDRFSREGGRETVNYLFQLEQYGARCVSFTEPFINTLGIFRDPIIALLGALAKQEKVRLSERVKAGLETAKKKGKRLGRKPIAPIEIKAVINAYEEEREKRSEDISVRRLAALTGRHRSVCHRILTDYKAGKLDKDGFRYDDPLFDLNAGVSKTLQINCR